MHVFKKVDIGCSRFIKTPTIFWNTLEYINQNIPIMYYLLQEDDMMYGAAWTPFESYLFIP